MNKAEEFRSRAYAVRAANVPSEKASAVERFKEILQLAEKASYEGEFSIQCENIHESPYVAEHVENLLLKEGLYIGRTMLEKNSAHYGFEITWHGPAPK